MNHDIFISYSSKQKSIADGVCHYLEENGFKCWMAPRDIPVGSEYGDLIEEAIKTSKVVVLVFSEAASISKWVKGEINVAFTEDKPILPFRIDETEIKGGFRVMLNQMHWIDAFPHYADRLPDLLNSICGLLGRKARKEDIQSGTTKSIGGKPNIINGHEYVDLDLPSGTLWATCNIGAVKPEDYGDYFAWGETKPKESYKWATYKFHKGKRFLTKYCINSEYGYHGFVDNLTILQPSDDAADVNWGKEWNIPTKGQWEELIGNTVNTWLTRNGVSGNYFYASNGEGLFLPAAGECLENSFASGKGGHGFYWTNSLSVNGSYSACMFHFRQFGFLLGRCNMGSSYRVFGMSIRPVLSPK